MINGVQVKKLIRHCDDRGYFMEILRDDDNLLSRFGQASMSKTYPGVIKAFHYHEQQDDLWFFPADTVPVHFFIPGGKSQLTFSLTKSLSNEQTASKRVRAIAARWTSAKSTL